MRSNSQHDIYVTLGASNHTDVERSQNDFYATDPDAVRDLIKREKFDNCILEPCAGMGHISDTLRKEGFNVCAMDLYDYGNSNVVSGIDFLKTDCKFDCDIISNPPYKCYSSDTQCYTKRGWLNYWELLEDDEFLSINPKNQEIEWVKSNKIISYNVDENLIHFTQSHMDILVTRGHRMYAFRDNNLRMKNGDLVHSEDIRNKDYIPRTGYIWNGVMDNYFILPSCYGKEKYSRKLIFYPEIKIKMEDWLKFFGFWLADGYCRHTINSQKNLRKVVGIKQLSKNGDYVRNILNNLPFKYKEYKDNYNNKNECINFEINNQQLYFYLSQFGKSENKFIPELIKNLHVNYLKIFINSYFNGDGSINKLKEGKYYTFKTISKKLAEDIQEILLKCGYLSHIIISEYERMDQSKVKLYMQNVSINSKYNKIYYKSSKNNRCDEHYKGKVWCVTLKKNGVFLLRRNGKEFFSGNCAESFVLKAIDSVTEGHKIAMFLKLQFLEGQKRYKDLFSKYPPSRIYVYTARKACSSSGKFYDDNGKKISSAVAYAWYVWEKGFTGKPTIEWI